MKSPKRKSGRFQKGNDVGKSTRFKKGRSGNPTGKHDLVPGKVDVTADDLGLLTRLASLGVRDCDLRRAMRVSEQTWRAIKLRDERVTDAIDEGKQRNHDPLWQRMYKKALGGDFMALAYCLNTRYGYRSEDQMDVAPRISITIPGPWPAGALPDGKVIEGTVIPERTDHAANVVHPLPRSGLETGALVPETEPRDAAPTPEAREYEPPRPPQSPESAAACREFENEVGIRTDRNSFATEAAWERFNRQR